MSRAMDPMPGLSGDACRQHPDDQRTGPLPFAESLSRHGLRLTRDQTTTLQVNVGLLCNLSCRHCHLGAGPLRQEVMGAETVAEVAAYAARNRFEAIDITGGAPELNPHIETLITRLAPLAPQLLLRTNLSALAGAAWDRFIALCLAEGVILMASFPSLNPAQTDDQRGEGAFQRAIAALGRLNAAGYGREGSGLELNLVSNPTGAFLPASERQAEDRFRAVLKDRWGLSFNSLFQFANVPLGRFHDWLRQTRNWDGYFKRLVDRFNPDAVSGVMCRSLVAVDWQGYLYDCDFNLAGGLHLGGRRIHVSEMNGPPAPGSAIATADYCYACTSGAGFT